MDAAQLGLGKLITTDQQRDAVHIAVAPVMAIEALNPGDHVGYRDGSVSESFRPHIGVIDPFLKETVLAREQCWLFLYPGTITSLRHEWIHPEFHGNERLRNANDTIARIADGCGLSTRRLLEAATEWVESPGEWGNYLHMGENESYKTAFYGHEEEFWDAYEIVTGKKVNDKGASFFSCSC